MLALFHAGFCHPKAQRPKHQRNLGYLSSSLPGIEIFAQSIADKVERQDRERDSETRKDQSVRRRLQR